MKIWALWIGIGILNTLIVAMIYAAWYMNEEFSETKAQGVRILSVMIGLITGLLNYGILG